MTAFKITPATSVLTTGANVHAFSSDSINPDSLTVDSSAYLIATGTGADGALLAKTGAWTVTVNGVIFSKQAIGIDIAAGNAATSTITISADGEVGGATAGIFGESAV